MKLLIHAPDPASFQRAVRNLKNVRAAEPSGQYELLLNGAAVAAAHDQGYSDPALRICHNSVAAQQIDVPDDWHLVDAAVVYAAQRQHAGWAYFRA